MCSSKARKDQLVMEVCGTLIHNGADVNFENEVSKIIGVARRNVKQQLYVPCDYCFKLNN